MRISGIGTDIVDSRRVCRILERFPKRFPERVLHDDEWSDYHDSSNQCGFLAKRFAAKEAIAKALGTGLADPVLMCNIRICHDTQGQPLVRLHGDCSDRYRDTEILLSVADETDYAIAYAMAVSDLLQDKPGLKTW